MLELFGAINRYKVVVVVCASRAFGVVGFTREEKKDRENELLFTLKRRPMTLKIMMLFTILWERKMKQGK